MLSGACATGVGRAVLEERPDFLLFIPRAPPQCSDSRAFLDGFEPGTTSAGVRCTTAGPHALVQVLDRQGLLAFLANPPERGFLQQFLPPHSHSDEVIGVIWTPSMCLVERRQNVHPFADARVPVRHRVVTEHSVHSREVACTPYLVQHLREFCRALAAEVLQVERQTVKKMHLLFKPHPHRDVSLVCATHIAMDAGGGGGGPLGAVPLGLKVSPPRRPDPAPHPCVPSRARATGVGRAVLLEKLISLTPSASFNGICNRQ